MMDELRQEAAAARVLELEEQAERARAEEEKNSEEAAKDTRLAGRRARAARERSEQLAKLNVDSSVIPGSKDGLPFNRVPHDAEGNPAPKAQRNFTDSDSRIMQAHGSYVQAYNVQVAVDERFQVVVACILTNQGPDAEHFVPVLRQVHQNLRRHPEQTTADAGFWSIRNDQYCRETGISAFISTRRRRHEEPLDPPLAEPQDAGPKRTMEAKVRSVDGATVYAKRKWTVEPVFGQAKEVRGFRRFSLRGLRKVRAESELVWTAHNLLKLAKNRKN